MPFVESDPTYFSIDTENNFITGGPTLGPRPEVESAPFPGLLETARATSREVGILNLGQGLLNTTIGLRRKDPHFNALETLDDEWKPFAEYFVNAADESDVELIKENILRKRETDQIIADSGIVGTGLLLAQSALDPMFIGAYKGIKFAKNAFKAGAYADRVKKYNLLRGTLSDIVEGTATVAIGLAGDEALLQQEQLSRSYEQSFNNITTGAFLGGVLGGVVGGISRSRYNKINKNLEKAFELDPTKEFNPLEPFTIDDLINGHVDVKREGIVKFFGRLNPFSRTITSEIPATRMVALNLAESGIEVESKNFKGAPETTVRRRASQALSELTNDYINQYKAYSARIGKSNVATSAKAFFRRGSDFDSFLKEIADALSAGDESGIPEVLKAVESTRKVEKEILKDILEYDLYGIKAEKVQKAEDAAKVIRKELISKITESEKKAPKDLAKYEELKKVAKNQMKQLNAARDELRNARTSKTYVNEPLREVRIKQATERVNKRKSAVDQIYEDFVKVDKQSANELKSFNNNISKLEQGLAKNDEALAKQVNILKHATGEVTEESYRFSRKTSEYQDKIDKIQEAIDRNRDEVLSLKNQKAKDKKLQTIENRVTQRTKYEGLKKAEIDKIKEKINNLKEKRNSFLDDIQEQKLEIDLLLFEKETISTAKQDQLIQAEQSLEKAQENLNKTERRYYENPEERMRAVDQAQSVVSKELKKIHDIHDELRAVTKKGTKRAAELDKLGIQLEEAEANLKIAREYKVTEKDLDLGGTAKGYFHRVYDRQKIRRLRSQFIDDVSNYILSKADTTVESARKSAKEVYDTLTAGSDSTVYKNKPPKVKGPFKERTLTIPDEVLEPYLVRDALAVMDKWVSSVLPDIELIKRYGDTDGTLAKEAIRKNADQLIERNPDRAFKIEKIRDRDIKDIDRMIQRFRGMQGRAYEDGQFYSIIRTIRNYNNARLMGAVGLNVFVDVGQMVLTNGFFNTMGSITKLFLMKIADPETYKAFQADMRAMGIGVDSLSHSRRSLYELGNGDPLTKLEEISQGVADFTFKLSLMSQLDSFTKRVSGYMAAERIARNVKSKSLSTAEYKWMRGLGITDDMHAAIRSEIRQHASKEGNFVIYNTQNWTNKAALDTFADALKKIESISIVTPGIGDAPLLFDNPAWQLLFQYKRFAMAAMQRSMIPALQRTDAGVMAGLTTMFTGGILKHSIKGLLRGENPADMDLQKLMFDSIKNTDMAAYTSDAFGIAGALFGAEDNVGKSVGTILGPTGGFIFRDLPRASRGVFNYFTGDDVTKAQLQAIRVSLPWQNLFGIDQTFTAIQKSINE